MMKEMNMNRLRSFRVAASLLAFCLLALLAPATADAQKGGTTHEVGVDGDIQDAIDDASDGDTIQLAAGAVRHHDHHRSRWQAGDDSRHGGRQRRSDQHPRRRKPRRWDQRGPGAGLPERRDQHDGLPEPDDPERLRQPRRRDVQLRLQQPDPDQLHVHEQLGRLLRRRDVQTNPAARP